MTLRQTMRSNTTELRIAVEATPGVLPATPNWVQAEPNSYQNFGAELKLVARQPINTSRQRKKGVIVGLSAAGGFESDLTAKNMQVLLPGFMFAALRESTSFACTAVTGTGYTVPSGGALAAGTLIFVEDQALSGNNGLKVVGAASTGTEIKVSGLVADTGDCTITVVGRQFVATDLSIDATTNDLPLLKSAAFDLTTLGLLPGEIIYIGGDGSGVRFAAADDVNNGWARVKSSVAGAITLDKTDFEMVDDAGTGKTVQIFFGHVSKNELGTLIVPTTFQLERALGAPDTAAPSDIQGEYLVGALPNEFKFNMPEEDKITVGLSFMAQDYETVTGTEGLKSGDRPTLEEADAFNTSGDVKRIRMAVYPDEASNTSAPTPLFAIVNEMDLTIKNNLSENKGLGHIGAVEITEGFFEVMGSVTAYFVTVAATQSVRDNADITFDFCLWKDNQGIAVDFPMLALGNGRLAVEQNKSVRIPLDLQAATGAKYDANMDHTLLIVFFTYLPDAADTRVD